MIARLLLNHAGLVRPFHFERTLIVAASAGLGLLVGIVALYFWAGQKLPLGTPRAWYFVYVGGLAMAALVLARWPRLAAVVLALAAIEAGLGIGSALLYKFRLTPSQTLFPSEYSRTAYTRHPVLQAVPRPTPPDVKVRFTINSLGFRGPERSPGSLDGKAVVALFGGSTTFDFGSPQGLSWGERLEELLGPGAFAVINHASGAYTTVESLIQTAFYESSFGARPRCAIYYVGWNDLRSSHVRNLDPAYADTHLRMLVDTLEARRLNWLNLSLSPIGRLVARFSMLAFDTARPAVPTTGTVSDTPDPVLEALYARNIGAISAINRDRGIRTLWVGQILNRAELTADTPYGWLPYIRDRDVWPLTVHLNGVVRREAAQLGDLYIDIPVEAFDAGDFIDQGHFQPRGSEKFARLLAPAVAQACR